MALPAKTQKENGTIKYHVQRITFKTQTLAAQLSREPLRKAHTVRLLTLSSFWHLLLLCPSPYNRATRRLPRS